MNYLWMISMVVFIFVEIMTVQFLALCFAIGSAGALIASLLGYGFSVQVATFILISIPLVITSSLILKKYIVKTRAGRSDIGNPVGDHAVVIETIPLQGKGKVRMHDTLWNAIGDEVIESGERVRIVKVSGNTLVVTRENENIADGN